ncbi:MAG TPA: hypothetical protein VLX44_04490 [Xanthobacteraceae bacterium]|nr:hypothetical protein [Xanthobacteraceae bacterium]
MGRTAASTGIVVALIAAAILRPPLGQAAEPDPGWRAYADAKSGTRVDYPAGMFSVAEGPFRFGSGEGFGTADGRAHLAIFTMQAEKGGSPAAFVARNLQVPRSALHYQRIAPTFFAISGIHDSDIYYVRCNSASDRSTLHCIYLIYPTAEKRAWDPIVTRISRTLRP